MHRIGILILCMVIASLGMGESATADQDEAEKLCIPMGTILLEAPASVTAKKAAVHFPHAKHFDYSCQTCHHKWEKESEIVGCQTSGCHDLAKAPAKGEEADAIRYYKTAFHDSCIGCHKTIKMKRNKMAASGSVL